MKKVLLTLLALVAFLTPVLAQNDLVLSKDGIGPVKMGINYTKAKPVMSKTCHMIWEMYHDMIDMMQVTCFDNETDRNLMVIFNTGEAPDDKLLRTFYVYSPVFKTAKGLSLDSTAQELLDAGGELDRKDGFIFVKLDGLYYSFGDNDLEGRKLKPNAKPYQISNVNYPIQ